jgi:uncharacterized protein YcaQ
MMAEGVVTAIEVEGSKTRWLALTRDLPLLARAGRRPGGSEGTTLLAPFDSLLWYRDRVSRLFGFDYRIEVYTPGHKRVHGYYTLPILHHGQLVGRLDAKTQRAEQRLDVRHVHFERWAARGVARVTGEPPLDRDEMLSGLAETIGSLARFMGAERVTVERVTPARLRAPLARAVSDRAAGPARPRNPGAPRAGYGPGAGGGPSGPGGTGPQ